MGKRLIKRGMWSGWDMKKIVATQIKHVGATNVAYNQLFTLPSHCCTITTTIYSFSSFVLGNC